MDLGQAYEVLGLPIGATLQAVKGRYRQLVRRYHPDLSRTSRTERDYTRVVDAWRTIQDAFSDDARDPAEKKRVDPGDRDLDFGDSFDVLRLRLGGVDVPLEKIGQAVLECSEVSDSGVQISITFVGPWSGGIGQVSAILKIGRSAGEVSGKILAVTRERSGVVVRIEFEPILQGSS